MPGPNEERTRIERIDPALLRAGWDVADPDAVGLEIPVDGKDPAVWAVVKPQLDELFARGEISSVDLPIGISDYVLKRANGEVLAVVEAKRTSVDPRIAQTQTEFYMGEIAKRQSFKPFGFMTNGYEIYFLDPQHPAKRTVRGFFNRADLENRLFLQQHRQPLGETAINKGIVDRSYQHEAIRRIGEAFDKNKRRALLVMATGTGKTRTTMALIDVLLKANQARNILFVADRDALVTQALTDGFKKFLPDEPCTRIHTTNITTSSRLYTATLQTISMCFSQFSPGFFDVMIFDEVHRSIFSQWREVLDYFDARIVGLTATPASFIGRDTFLTFQCENEAPTFLYTYDEAIRDGYLVNYSIYRARTKFQRDGIKGANLTEEERNLLIEQGHDPDELDYAGSELEKTVSNLGTLRRQWEEIIEECYKDRAGQLPGKTIVFAVSQAHARRLVETFDEMFPDWAGMARVITSDEEYKGHLLKAFKNDDYPRIAVTVDLLETGVDIPEAVNLVFMKPVHSRIKLMQMIGRGTRNDEACRFREWLPEGHKKDFKILDFWENEFDLKGDPAVAQSLPVLVTIFNTRLDQMEHYVTAKAQHTPSAQTVIAALRNQISQINPDTYGVKGVWREIEGVWRDDFWTYLNAEKLKFLRLKVGPLLRLVSATDTEAATFTSKIERLKRDGWPGRRVPPSARRSGRMSVGCLILSLIMPAPAR